MSAAAQRRPRFPAHTSFSSHTQKHHMSVQNCFKYEETAELGARCGGKSYLSFSVTVCLSVISPKFTCSRRTIIGTFNLNI